MTTKEIKLVMLALMSSLLLAALDQTIVATALTTIVSDLGSAGKLSWVITAYLLSSIAVMPLYGKIGDLYGRKKILLLAISLFLVGSTLCGLSNSMLTLVLARVFQGLGAGGLFPLITATIAEIIPLKDRAKYQGGIGAVFAIASIAGPLLGGVLTDLFTWRAIFLINLPIGFVALALVKKNLHNKEVTHKHKIDFLGAVLGTIGITALLAFMLFGGKSYGWLSWQILSLLLIGIIALYTFLKVEQRVVEPILPLTLFKNKVVLINVIISFLTGVVLFGVIIYLSIFLQVVKGFSPTISGLALLPLTLGIYPATMSVGRGVSKGRKIKSYPIIGFSLLALATLALTSINSNVSYLWLGGILFVVGLGLGMLMQLPSLVVTSILPKELIGVGASTVTLFRSLGSAVGTAIFGTILNFQLSKYLSELMGQIFKEKIVMPTEIDSFAALDSMPDTIKKMILESFTHAMNDIYLVAFFLTLVGVMVSVFMPNLSIKERSEKL